ncbi:hypothetical protein MGU_10621 [Metarhizium guizhouense ARSEF 977]|uniref:Uncharacterized protein n=1 Tax=Metarhizium guizhouense (strain ARSEF 977) TaxID=1276136 RepID=A0A0B4GX43_METGA|nr:hypothetical protein MGU_10621 [Metarhizium guizhouense ARSEF 977]
MPRRAIPAEQKQTRKAEKSEADRVRRISQLEENVARLREKYKNNPYVQVAGDRATRPNVASDLHMQNPERHMERAYVAQQVGDTRAVSISSTAPGASTPATQLLFSRMSEKGVRDPAADDMEECHTPSNHHAVSVDQTGKPSVEDARAQRERILPELMAQEAKEGERGPIVNNAVNNLRSSEQVNAVTSQLSLQPQTSSAPEAPIISGAVTSRLTTDLTFRPRLQIEQTQQARHGKSPTTGPPDAAVEHAEAARPKAAPARSGVDRIHRQGNSQERLKDALKRAEGVEAGRIQVRRQRELDYLVRASTSHARTNHVKDNCHESRLLQQQDSGQKKIFAAKSAAPRAGHDTATWIESQVKPLPEMQQSARTVRDAITVAANHPRPAAAVTISSTSTRETTPATRLPESSPAQSPPRAPETTDTYRPSVPRNEERASRLARDGGYISETPSPGPPLQARSWAPSSMEEESLAASPWGLPQRRHISRADGTTP